VFVASTSFNAPYVIGEVQHAGKVSWEGNLSLMDAVDEAGGSTTKAKLDHVLVVSGGLADPTLKLVDAGGFLYRGEFEDKIALGRGDIVHVPMTALSASERYFDYAMKVVQSVLASEERDRARRLRGQHPSGQDLRRHEHQLEPIERGPSWPRSIFRSRCIVSSGGEIVGAFLRGEAAQSVGNGLPEVGDGSRRSGAQ
jgi:hypothetical protein